MSKAKFRVVAAGLALVVPLGWLIGTMLFIYGPWVPYVCVGQIVFGVVTPLPTGGLR